MGYESNQVGNVRPDGMNVAVLDDFRDRNGWPVVCETTPGVLDSVR